MNQCEKDRLIDEHVTLNGLPAKISGRLMPFARVRALPATSNGMHISADYAWHTVANIVATGGAFKA